MTVSRETIEKQANALAAEIEHATNRIRNAGVPAWQWPQNDPATIARDKAIFQAMRERDGKTLFERFDMAMFLTSGVGVAKWEALPQQLRDAWIKLAEMLEADSNDG